MLIWAENFKDHGSQISLSYQDFFIYLGHFIQFTKVPLIT